MAISLALLAYPAYLGIKAYRLPWIYDITTDPIDPPRYEALARLRPRDANPVAYAGLYAAEQQRSAYPDIGPLGTNASPAGRLRRRARGGEQAQMARGRCARPPGRTPRGPHRGRRAYPDHGISRRRRGPRAPDPDGTRIDARSSSRYGSFDFGTNAARVRGVMNDIEDAIRTQKPERPPAPAPAPAKKGTAGKKDQPRK